MPAYEVQVKEWAEQYEAAHAALEMQHPDLDQEEAERVKLTALLDELEHPQVLPSLDNATEVEWLMKTRLAIVSILILLTTFIVGLSVHRIYLEKQKASRHAAGEAALAAHQWAETLAQFEALSVLDPNYRDVSNRLNEAHYLGGVAYLKAGQFAPVVSELGQVAPDYRDTEDKLAKP